MFCRGHAPGLSNFDDFEGFEGGEMLKKLATLSVALICLSGADAQTNSYKITNIVTSAQDSRLINPWGLARPGNAGLKENEWWVNGQVSGLSLLYDVDGTKVDLAVKIPPAQGIGTGSPTGAAFNPTSQSFVFATLDGTISAWNPLSIPTPRGPRCSLCHVSSATIMVNRAANGASYQGLAIATNATSGALTYYAANANAGVEAYDAQSFSPVTLPAGAFTDALVPASYTPAGIQAFGSTIFVTYNATAGGGTGYVDAYDTNGTLLLRLERGFFNQPWGVVVTPANFGKFSSMILVGNTGSGLIGAYKFNGVFQGFLEDGTRALNIPGLWGLAFGNGNTQSGPTNVLYFSAGGASQTTGVFGAITAD
jgi:uncharacterized protein (TIGR03118 family)